MTRGQIRCHQPDSCVWENHWNDHIFQQLCGLPQASVQLPSVHVHSSHMPSYFPSLFVHRHCSSLHMTTFPTGGLQLASVQLPAKHDIFSSYVTKNTWRNKITQYNINITWRTTNNYTIVLSFVKIHIILISGSNKLSRQKHIIQTTMLK